MPETTETSLVTTPPPPVNPEGPAAGNEESQNFWRSTMTWLFGKIKEFTGYDIEQTFGVNVDQAGQLAAGSLKESEHPWLFALLKFIVGDRQPGANPEGQTAGTTPDAPQVSAVDYRGAVGPAGALPARFNNAAPDA